MTAYFFGRFLLERDVITPQALLQALTLQEQSNTNLGNLAIAQGLLTKEEISRLHRQQRTVDRKIGELAVEEGLLSPAQSEALLDEQQRSHLRLGEALVRTGSLERKRMQSELSAFLKVQAELEVNKRRPASNALIERAARLTQNLLLRLARLPVKIGDTTSGAGTAFAFAVATQVPQMEIMLACSERIARTITEGLLGFQPDNLTREDDQRGLCEFFAALSQQLGGSGLARTVITPLPEKKNAQSCALHGSEESFALIFVPMA